MDLKNAIKEIPDYEWLEIIQETSNKYRCFLGRAPKKFILGEVLNYEVLQISESRMIENDKMHRFLVKKQHKR